MKDYYVYKHLNMDGSVFYVGRGKDTGKHNYYYRSTKMQNRSPEWFDKVNNNKILITIIEAFHLTLEEANKMEKDLISKYGRDNLVNKTDGGSGTPGSPRKMSEETKAKLVKAHTGRKHSEETKRRRSKSLMGHTVSKEAREKLRLANVGKTYSSEINKSKGRKK